MSAGNRSNVLDIRTGGKARAQAANDAVLERRRLSPAAAHLGRMLGRGALSVARHTAFLAMLWLRGPVRLCLGLFAYPCVLAIPMVYLGMPPAAAKNTMLLWLTVAGLSAFTVRWFYDSFLLWLSPSPFQLQQ